MKRLIPWLVVAVVIRLLLIFFTIHPDIRGYNLGAYIISQKGEFLGFYDYIANLPRQHDWVKVYGDNLFIYPPLAYLIPAFFMKLLSPFYNWNTFGALIKDMDEVVRSGVPLWGLLLLLKTPFLVFDFASFWILGKLFEDKEKKFFAQMLWLFNPVTIYTSYMVSQFDVFIAFFILLAILLYVKERGVFAALSLGLAAGVKVFPLLLLPFLAFRGVRGWRGRIGILAAGVGTYFVIIFPYLGSIGFRQYALLASQTDKIFFAKIPVSGAEFLPLFLVIYLFLVWWACWQPERFSLWQWFLFVLLTFYSVTHYHPQWFVWIAPLFVMLLVKHLRLSLLPVLTLLASYILIVFMFEPSLNFGLFYMLNQDLSKVSVVPFIGRFYEVNVFARIVRGVFAATALFLVFRLSREKSI